MLPRRGCRSKKVRVLAVTGGCHLPLGTKAAILLQTLESRVQRAFRRAPPQAVIYKAQNSNAQVRADLVDLEIPGRLGDNTRRRSYSRWAVKAPLLPVWAVATT